MLTGEKSALRRPQFSPEARRALEHALFGLLPLLMAFGAFYFAFSGGYAAGDFRHSFLVAGWREIHGIDPYHWTRAQIVGNISFPYPAPVAILLEPFALLPGGVAADVYLILCVAAVAGTLRLMGVRDWRVFGVTLLWSPTLIGWQTGNFTLPILLGLAAMWRYRDRPGVMGVIAALLISIKPIMFPVGVWLLITRRYRAAAFGAVFGAVLNVVAWTVIGWGEFGRWLHLVSVQGTDLYRTGYSVIALVSQLGGGRSLGTAIEMIVAIALLGTCARLGWIRREASAFVLAVTVCLAASPLIDQHYFALLVVPLAIAFPRLRWPWVLPVVLWLCPATGGTASQIGLWLLTGAVTVVVVLRGLSSDQGAPPAPALGRDPLPAPAYTPEHGRLLALGHRV